MGTPRTARLFECPRCGGFECPVRINDFDDLSQKLRERRCSNPGCELGTFSTIEVPILDPHDDPVPLTQIATHKREQARERQRQRMGYQSRGTRIVSGMVAVIVRYTPPRKKQPPTACWRGHVYTAESSMRRKSDGKMVCRACRRISGALYRANHVERVRQNGREAQRRLRARRRLQNLGEAA